MKSDEIMDKQAAAFGRYWNINRALSEEARLHGNTLRCKRLRRLSWKAYVRYKESLHGGK